jgi:hypothetical protein
MVKDGIPIKTKIMAGRTVHANSKEIFSEKKIEEPILLQQKSSPLQTNNRIKSNKVFTRL